MTTSNQPIIGEETHKLGDDAKIKTFESVIKNYETQQQGMAAQIETMRINLVEAMETNARLRNTTDLWKALAIIALLMAIGTALLLVF